MSSDALFQLGMDLIMVQAPPKRKKSFPGALSRRRGRKDFSVSVMGFGLLAPISSSISFGQSGSTT